MVWSIDNSKMEKINFASKLKQFNELWSPRVIAQMNDYEFKLVKIKDEFVWHSHDHTDEVFIVLQGVISIEFEDRIVELNQGEMLVVPRGEKHKPFAREEAQILLVEPKGVVNTGEVESHLTAKNGQWI